MSAPELDPLDLSTAELLVLQALPRDPDYARSFRGIQQNLTTPMDPDVTKAAARLLRARGLTDVSKGLWTEDGDLAGSGYHLTTKGADVVRALELAASQQPDLAPQIAGLIDRLTTWADDLEGRGGVSAIAQQDLRLAVSLISAQGKDIAAVVVSA